MPEGPELYLSSRFINASCKDRIFTGKVVKSDVHKSSEVHFEAKAYTISALSRGKEIQLILTKLDDHSKPNKKLKIKADPDFANCTKILFRFGMSGKFELTSVANVHKHAHLQFYTNDKPVKVLSHVDVRRFGRWQVNADWSNERGPDPMFEYQQFRANVLSNLHKSIFDQPICEILLNQKYFNGIGNYLRAEILYRLRIPPFEKARTVFEGLTVDPPDAKPSKSGKVASDILHVCHTVPLEVVNLRGGGGGYDPEGKSADNTAFSDWLQCYYQNGMKNMVDHNKRTIWFTGPAGPLVPKESKSRSRKTKKKKKESAQSDYSNSTAETRPKKTKREIKSTKTASKMKKYTETAPKTPQKFTRSNKAGTVDGKITISRSRRKSVSNYVLVNKPVTTSTHSKLTSPGGRPVSKKVPGPRKTSTRKTSRRNKTKS